MFYIHCYDISKQINKQTKAEEKEPSVCPCMWGVECVFPMTWKKLSDQIFKHSAIKIPLQKLINFCFTCHLLIALTIVIWMFRFYNY